MNLPRQFFLAFCTALGLSACGGGCGDASTATPARLELVAGSTFPGEQLTRGNIVGFGDPIPLMQGLVPPRAGTLAFGANGPGGTAALADGSVVVRADVTALGADIGAVRTRVARVMRNGDVSLYTGFSGSIGCGFACIREGYVSVGASPAGKAYVYDELSASVTVISASGIEQKFALDVPRDKPATLDAPDIYTVTPLAADNDGNLWFFGRAGLMRRQANGTVQLVSADARLGRNALAADAAGNVYAASRAIYKVTPAGTVSLVAGADVAGATDGTGASARFNEIRGLAVDRAGNLYAADTFIHAVRKVTPDGTVSSAVGAIGQGTFRLGALPDARLLQPFGVAVAPAGGLWVTTANAVLFADVP